MHSHAIKGRLVLPVAAMLTLGLVSVPHAPGAEATGPRLTEVSAVRLQAEVTSLVTGMAGAVGAEAPAAAAVAAASSLTGGGTSTAATASCAYPCTVLDKFLWNLPVDVRNALLPPIYAVAWVIGLIMAPVVLVTSALFGWPSTLPLAAAVTPENAPAPAPVEATPASAAVPGQTANAGDDAAKTPTGSDDARTRVRADRIAAAEADPTDGSASSEAVSGVSAEASPGASPETSPESLPEAFAPALTAIEEAAPLEQRPARPHARSAEAVPSTARPTETGPSDSAPAAQRAIKRSAR